MAPPLDNECSEVGMKLNAAAARGREPPSPNLAVGKLVTTAGSSPRIPRSTCAPREPITTRTYSRTINERIWFAAYAGKASPCAAAAAAADWPALRWMRAQSSLTKMKSTKKALTEKAITVVTVFMLMPPPPLVDFSAGEDIRPPASHSGLHHHHHPSRELS
uniref:Uncharacterized protein n=1 Tax=Oryza glumipatula TaxID=40148 RepID=A0A0D9YT32_9ORYZ